MLICHILTYKNLINNMESKNWGRVVNIVSSSAYGAAPNTGAYFLKTCFAWYV